MECCAMSVSVDIDLLSFISNWAGVWLPMIAIIISALAVIMSSRGIKKAHKLDLLKEDRQRNIEKVEELFIAGRDHYQAVYDLHQEYLRWARMKVLKTPASERPPIKKNLDPFKLSSSKLEMLFFLHFPEEDFPAEKYDLRAYPAIKNMWANHWGNDDKGSAMKDTMDSNLREIEVICKRLMIENRDLNQI